MTVSKRLYADGRGEETDSDSVKEGTQYYMKQTCKTANNRMNNEKKSIIKVVLIIEVILETVAAATAAYSISGSR